MKTISCTCPECGSETFKMKPVPNGPDDWDMKLECVDCGQDSWPEDCEDIEESCIPRTGDYAVDSIRTDLL